MAFNGSGVFTLVAGNPVVTGTTISSTWANNTLSDIATGLSTTLTKDGQSTPTADIPMGGFKVTGLGAATLDGDALRFQDKTTFIADFATKAGVQVQTYTAFTTAGTTTAYTLTPTPAIGSLVAGQRFRVKFNAANTTQTPTLAVSGLAATALKVYDAAGAKQNPAVGALALDMLTDVEYDGTDYVVMTPAPGRRVAQVVNTTTGAVATGTTAIPYDDTIPQITEGDEYMTRAITPTNQSSTLEINVVLFGSHSAASSYLTACLHQDAIANALAVGNVFMPTATGPVEISFKYVVSAASLTARTYRVRAGSQAAGTFTFNGSSGTRFFGGVMVSSITITEYLP